MTTFQALGLAEPLLRALDAQGHTIPTPIQTHAIPALLAGKDVLGLAQTGTGKTAAFALPILDRFLADQRRAAPKLPRALVLTPTRELAIQIAGSFSALGRGTGLRNTVVYGGVGQVPQVKALARGVEVLVATPGRLLDHLSQGNVRLDAIEVLVLDEADRMLDMGFVRDVRKIVAAVPTSRQTLLFSATLPDAVADLAQGLLRAPERVEVTPQASTVDKVDQRVLFVSHGDKRALLSSLLQNQAFARTIVFTRTKHGANRVAEHLEKAGVSAAAIHGNKSQSARQRALDGFRSGAVRTLVATDIAARGIDVTGVTHVINFELPVEPESYVHRIGRTARAGREGIALSFCAGDEVGSLRAIERTIRQSVPVDADHPFHSAEIARGKGLPRPQSAGPRPGRPQRPHRQQQESRRQHPSRGGDRARQQAAR